MKNKMVLLRCKSPVSAHPEPVEGLVECENRPCFDKLNMSGLVNIVCEHLSSKNKIKLHYLVVSAILALYTFTSAEYDPNLRYENGMVSFLRRIDAEQKPFAELSLMPIRYQSILNYFQNEIDTTALSTDEKIMMHSLLNYVDPRRGRVKWFNDEKDIHFRVRLSLTGDVKAHLGNNSGGDIRGIISPSMTGNLGKLSFYSGIDVWTEYNSDKKYPRSSYQPYHGIPYNLYGRETDSASVRSSDIPRGGIQYDAGAVKIQAAIDYLRSGPAVCYPVTLSGEAPPVTYLKTDLDMSVIQYSHLAGILRSQKDKPKYIYFHRLSSMLFDNKLQLGISEVIINGSTTSQYFGDTDRVSAKNYQDRSWEMVYLIPFVPFKFVEHYAGDRDNAALSLDLTLWWPKRFRWYGEMFLDDMLAPWKLFSRDWGNKWALTCGMQYFGSIKGRDFETLLEYSHVEPWVYTHFYGGSHQYTNFDKSLGSQLGPNSQALTALFQMTVTPLHIPGFGLWHEAQNTSVRGGEITDIFQLPQEDTTLYTDSEVKRFLGKGTKIKIGPVLTYQLNPFGKIQVKFRYELDVQDVSEGSRVFLNGGFVF